jgi:sugar lactone lactonase YvrE
MKFCNDLDLDGDVIYFIDTSYARGVNEFLEEHVEALPRGRLFSYNEKTDKLEVLLNDLFFPNGMQLTPTNDVILINENTMARITKYFF